MFPSSDRCAAATPARSRPGLPFGPHRAYTLVELVASMACASVLVAGLASTMMMSSRVLSRDSTPGADANRSAEALVRIAGDVRQAMRFTERTATAMTVVVPDRDGDGLAERIRYSWSGTSGHPLMYQYNSEPALAIVDDVKQFNLNAITRSIVADPVVPPPAPVVYEQRQTTAAGTSATSLTINTPTGANTGKLFIAAVAVDGAAGPTLTGPAGWNLLGAVNSGGQVGMAVWWKIAGAAEPANYTFSWTGGVQAYGWIMRFAGANPLSPINTFNAGTGTSSNPTCPSVTTSEGYTMILRLGGFDRDRITASTSNIAQHTGVFSGRSNTDGGAVSGAAAYRNLGPPGSSGTGTFALSGSEEFVTFTVAIAPQPN